MTNYITIYGVRKRDFTIQAQIPEMSTTPYIRENDPDIRITRAGDTRITRAGDIRVTRSYTTLYPRLVSGVQKRSFVVHAKVKNG